MDNNGPMMHQEAPVLKLELFEDIARCLEEIHNYQKEESEAKRKALKLEDYIEHAKAAISKAEEKKAHLVKKNELLKANLEDMKERTGRALEYWKDYGFDVEQLSADTQANCYKYIYTKLPALQRYTVDLSFLPKEVKIIAQEPQVLNPDELSELNQRLTSNCLHDNTTDYKLAMLMIRKLIITKSKNTPVVQN